MTDSAPPISHKEIKRRVRESFKAVVSETHWLVRVMISSADRFYWDNGFSKAASLAYSSLLSLVPLTVLCFGMLGSFIQTPEQAAQIQQFLFQQFLPVESLTDVLDWIHRLSQNIRALNYVVITTLIVTSLLLLNSIEYALNEVWQVYEARPITDRLAIFCAIIVLVPLFAVSGYYTTTKVEPFLAGYGILSTMYEDAVPFLIDFLAFVALYFLVPKAPVKVGAACLGAFSASVLFGMAKHWFALYLVRFTRYDQLYGALAAVPIFLFWLYVSWSIVLIGAEISYQAQHLPRTGKLWKRSLMSVGDGAMLLAIQTLVMVVHAFRRGEKIPNELEIAEHIGCSSVVLKPTLDALTQAGIIMRGGGRDMPLLLMRSPEMITVAEIREAVFKKRTSMFLGTEVRRLYECFSVNGDPKKVSLADLAKE
jgi:membrane protein